MSTAIAKILISFDEYIRLKEIEKKYEELKAEQKGMLLAIFLLSYFTSLKG